MPAGSPFEESEYEGIVFTGKYANYTNADTWYPSWAEDGHMYSQWTDGAINGNSIMSIDGQNSQHSSTRGARVGQARIEGDDPMNLKVVNLGHMEQSGNGSINGRYPCANLVYNGTWYNGSYLLTYNNQTEDEGCDIWNWPQVEGFVGLRTATMQDWEEGMTITKEDYPWNRYITQWTETANYDENGHPIWVTQDPDGTDPLFGEFHDTTGEIRFGAPHFVDFGQNMEYAPVNEKGEKMAYLVGHGATQYGAFNSWVQGDAIFLARVVPDPETINDMSSWEFYAGRDANGEEIWTHNFDDLEPIARWDSHMGNVAITYNQPLDKFFMTYSRGINQQQYDSVILEADELTGPYKMIHYLENFGPVTYFTTIPSKFISEDGKTMWLCSSGNFYNKASGYPEHSHYSMMLREFTLVEEGDEVPEQNAPFVNYTQTFNPASEVPADATNLALSATATGSSTYNGYNVNGIKDGNLGGYGATAPQVANTAYEWATKGEGVGAWAKLEWATGQTVASVRLFDRPNNQDLILHGTLEFSDGTKIAVESLPDDGKTGRAVNLPTPLENITWVKYTVDAVGACMNIGLSEFEVYDKALDIEADANLALSAKITTSSTMAGYPESSGLNDGVADGWPRNTSLEWRSDGQTEGAWIDMQWDEEQTVSMLKIYQNKKRGERITDAYLIVNGDYTNPVELDGFDPAKTETLVSFATQTNVESLRLVIDGVQSGDENVNITEICAYCALNIDTEQPAGVLEAELAALSDAQIVADDNASTDYAVRMQQAGSTITFTATENWNDFAIVYQAAADADCVISVNGTETELTLPYTGSQWKEYPITQAVAAGQTVVLTTPKAVGPIVVDCLKKDYTAVYESNPAYGVNLALFKPVTATNPDGGFPAYRLVDGSQGTWSDYWQPKSEPSEIVIDLKAVFKLNRLVLKVPTNWAQTRHTTMTVLVSDDGSTYDTALAEATYVFAPNNADASKHQTCVISIPSDQTVAGRYVKLVMSDMKYYEPSAPTTAVDFVPQLSEVEIYGEALSDDVVGINLALGKTISVSGTGSGCSPANCITDGQQGDQDIEFWTTNGDSGSVTVDLTASYELTELTLKLPYSLSNWMVRSYDVEVLVSEDGTDGSYVAAGEKTRCSFNWSQGNTATITLPAGTQGRYVKLNLSNGFYDSGNYSLAPQLSELIVYGKKHTESISDTNLALRKTITCNAEATDRWASYIVDGSQNTFSDFWEPGTMNGGWIMVDLGKSYQLNRFVLKQPTSWAEPRTVEDVEILTSTDGVHFDVAIEAADLTFDNSADGNSNIITINAPENVTGRYVKITMGKSYWWLDNNPGKTTAVNPQLSELEVYGEELDQVTGISLSEDALTMKAWQTYDGLQVAITPAGAVGCALAWSSSDLSVAKVDSIGVIQAQGDGTCIIRVRPADSILSDTLTLTVTENDIASVDSFADMTVKSGIAADDLALPAKVVAHLDGVDVQLRLGQWVCDSYDPEVSAAYTFTAPLVLLDGMTNSNNLTAQIIVKVEKKVTGVSLDNSEITLEKGETEILTALVEPADANDVSVSWKSSDSNIVAVDSKGTVTALKKGTATVTVTTNDGNKSASCVVTVQDTAGDMQAAADAVEALIDAIGEVSVDSKEAIEAAREAYDALTDEQKEMVSNYQTLVAAEEIYPDLLKAAEVIALIDAIGEVTLDSEEMITEARKAYDALTDAQKALVTNMKTLTDAEAKLAQLKEDAAQAAADKAAAEAVEDKINAIGEVTLDTQEAIEAAREAYDDLTDAQKNLVTNTQDLIDAEHVWIILKTEAYAAEAETAADAAQKAYEDALAVYDKAQAEIAEDKTAAEEAQAEAEAALAAAEEAQAKAEQAKQAAEAAKKAAGDANADAAAEAVKAAQEAAKGAQTAQMAAENAAKTAEALAKAQAAQAAAEEAQKVAQEAEKLAQDAAREAEDALADAEQNQKEAEEAAAAAKEAQRLVELGTAKYTALYRLSVLVRGMDELNEHESEALDAVLEELTAAIEAAETVEEVQQIMDGAEEAINGIETECYAAQFTDVDLNSYYHDSVDFMVGNGYMNGTSGTTFAPNADTNRAMLATLLYRIAGEPGVEGLENPFADVPTDAYYYKAVVWAASKGIVNGKSADTFAPNASITRQEMVTMLWRYVGEPETEADLSAYTDGAEAAEYAKTAMAWAVENGIISGMTATTLAPTGTANRAQIATVLMRYLSK